MDTLGPANPLKLRTRGQNEFVRLSHFRKTPVGFPLEQHIACRIFEDLASPSVKNFVRFFCSPSDIQNRQHILNAVHHLSLLLKEDENAYTRELKQAQKLLQKGGDFGTLETRNQTYQRHADHAFHELFNVESDRALEHLIHVSCTGYHSPSAAEKLVSQHFLEPNLTPNCVPKVTHIYHMGCAAAFPAIRTALGSLHTPTNLGGVSSVDIVHTEFCSLHFKHENITPDQIVIQSLFGDGAIRYQAHKNNHAQIEKTSSNTDASLKIHALAHKILPNTQDKMVWSLADGGFSMLLDRHIPEIIRQEVSALIMHTLSFELNAQYTFEALQNQAIFAVHPGGPKIVDEIQDVLNLQNDQLQHSRQILKNFGNMSSATVPHIWDSILRDPLVPLGTPILSLAFAPGLTLWCMIGEKA